MIGRIRIAVMAGLVLVAAAGVPTSVAGTISSANVSKPGMTALAAAHKCRHHKHPDRCAQKTDSQVS
ncbi:MAG: hypothetical protein ABSD74_15450 [Rhizomicrobium sp.]|jgi:hypothetical protein